MKKRHLSSDDRLNPIILQQEIIYLRAELDKYRLKVRDYQENYHYSQLEKLKNENSQLLEELNDSKSQLEEMNHNNLFLQDTIIEQEAILEQIKNEIEHLHDTKRKQEEVLTEKENRQKDLLRKNAALEKEIDMLQTEKLKTGKKLVNLQKQYEKVQSECQNLQLELSTKDRTIQELKKQIEKLNEEIMNAGNSLQQVKLENRKALEENKRNQEEAEKQKHSSQQLQNHITFLKKELEQQHDKQIQGEETIQKLQDANQLLSDQKKQIMGEVQIYKGEINNKQDQVQHLKNHTTSLEQKLTEYQDKQLKNKVEIQDLQNVNARFKEEMWLLKEDKLSLESFQIEMFAMIEGLKQEIISFKSGEMMASSSQNTRQLANNDKFYQQIQDLLWQINEYGEKISTSMSRTNQLEEHINDLTDEITRLKNKLSASSIHEKSL